MKLSSVGKNLLKKWILPAAILLIALSQVPFAQAQDQAAVTPPATQPVAQTQAQNQDQDSDQIEASDTPDPEGTIIIPPAISDTADPGPDGIYKGLPGGTAAATDPANVKRKFPSTIAELFDPKYISKQIRKAWEQSEIGGDIDLPDLKWSFLDGGYLRLKSQYSAETRPAFISTLQQRLDEYTVEIGPRIPFLSAAYADASLQAKVTFARLFPDKSSSVFVKPYWLNAIPSTIAGLNHYLKPGDIVRLDFSSGITFGAGPPGQTLLNGHDAENAGVSIHNGGELIVDIYRMKTNMVRMRFVEFIHRAELGLSASLNIGKLLTIGGNTILNWIQGTFSIAPLSVSYSTNLLKKKPVEAFMVDYVFNLDKPAAVAAYDDIMTHFYARKFVDVMSFRKNPDGLKTHLLDLVNAAEIQADADVNKPAIDRGVDRIFKGETQTHFVTTEIRSRMQPVISIYDAKVTSNNSTLNVRGNDAVGNPQDMIFMTTTHDNLFKAFQGLWHVEETNTVETLFNGKPIDDGKIIHLEPTKLNDLVFIRNISRKKLRAGMAAKAKAYVDTSMPTVADKVNWLAFTNDSSKTNGYINIKFVFDGKILQYLKKVTQPQLEAIVTNVLIKDPYRHFIVASDESPDDVTGAPEEHDEVKLTSRLKNDTRKLVKSFMVILDDQSSIDARLNAFNDVRPLPLFSEVGPAILVRLLPDEKLKDLVSLSIKASALGQQTVDFDYGTNDSSAEYNTLQFMVSMMNNKSFDMRLQSDPNGHFHAIDGDGVKADLDCASCDQLNAIPLSTDAMQRVRGDAPVPAPPVTGLIPPDQINH